MRERSCEIGELFLIVQRENAMWRGRTKMLNNGSGKTPSTVSQTWESNVVAAAPLCLVTTKTDQPT
jgi:hypothetical protein